MTQPSPIASGNAQGCAGCGGPLPSQRGGRPRRFCGVCLPPVAVIGQAEYARRWRELNEEAVEAYNASRRMEVTGYPCRYCGTRFERPSTARRVFCSPGCERAADNARRRAAVA